MQKFIKLQNKTGNCFGPSIIFKEYKTILKQLPVLFRNFILIITMVQQVLDELIESKMQLKQ